MSFDLFLIVAVTAVPLLLAYVAANPPERNQPRRPYRRKIGLLCAISFALSVYSGKRQLDEIDHPEVSASQHWDTAYLNPDVRQHLVYEILVSSGTARQAQMYTESFVIRGPATAESDRQAVNQFKKFMVDNPQQPTDSKENKKPYHYEDPFTFEAAQIRDLETGQSTLYSMVYVEWQDKQGRILKYSHYVSMKVPPPDGYVEHVGWNRLMQ